MGEGVNLKLGGIFERLGRDGISEDGRKKVRGCVGWVLLEC